MENYWWWTELVYSALEAEDQLRHAHAEGLMVLAQGSKRQRRLEQQREVLNYISWAHGAAHLNPDQPCLGGLPHDHQAAGEITKPYEDHATIEHEFGDGWTIRRPSTYGDLKYEGEMMGHCIGNDADGEECPRCDGGKCDECKGEGDVECGGCHGNGVHECGQCYGDAHFDCENCNVEEQQAKCASCDGKGRKGWQPCNDCQGKGTVKDWTPGKVTCDQCDGRGRDEEGHECWSCDGEGSEECHDCGGEGHIDCPNCDGRGARSCDDCGGDGRSECYQCDGTGKCDNCEGKGLLNGVGPPGYYKKFSQDEADDFESAPGGPLSLRDPDNIPHTSFLKNTAYWSGGEPQVESVYGREDKEPKAEYQHRILHFMRPGDDEDCADCKGEGKADFTEPGAGGKTYKLNCTTCGGDGSARIHASFGSNSSKVYTRKDIDDIIHGNMEKPESFIISRKENAPNETRMYSNLGDARIANKVEDLAQTHELYAIRSQDVNHDSMVYNPARSGWELKSGRGSKVPLEEKGTRIPWNLDSLPYKDCPECGGKGTKMFSPEEHSLGDLSNGRPGTSGLIEVGCKNCNGIGEVHDHEAMSAKMNEYPDYVQRLIPKAAHIGDDDGRHHADDFMGWENEIKADPQTLSRKCAEGNCLDCKVPDCEHDCPTHNGGYALASLKCWACAKGKSDAEVQAQPTYSSGTKLHAHVAESH